MGRLEDLGFKSPFDDDFEEEQQEEVSFNGRCGAADYEDDETIKFLERPEWAEEIHTLDDAIAYLNARLRDGHNCPCCGRFAKVYKRKLNQGMAVGLIYFSRYYKARPISEWVEVNPYFIDNHGYNAANSNFALLRHWGLVEAKEAIRDDGSPHVGIYRITCKGLEFVRGEIVVPSHAYFYDREFLRLNEKTTTIRTALGNKFNYDELMAA